MGWRDAPIIEEEKEASWRDAPVVAEAAEGTSWMDAPEVPEAEIRAGIDKMRAEAGMPAVPKVNRGHTTAVMDGEVKADQAKYEARRRKFLRDTYAYDLTAPLAGMRVSPTKEAVKRITDPVDRQWLIEEVGKIAKQREIDRREQYATKGFPGRFLERGGQVAGAFASGGTGMVETAKKLGGMALGTIRKPEDIRFQQALETAKNTEFTDVPQDIGLAGEAATGAAGMAPDLAAGLLAFQTGGPPAAMGYWTGRQAPERIESYHAAGLSPAAAAVGGLAEAAGEAAIEMIQIDPTGLAKRGLTGPIKQAAKKVSGRLKNHPAIREAISAGKRIGLETMEEGLQGVAESIGQSIAEYFGETLPSESTLGGELVTAGKVGLGQMRGAAPGIAVISGAGGGGRMLMKRKARLYQVAEDEMVAAAKSNKPPTRGQWKKWGMSPGDGKSAEARLWGVKEKAGQIKAKAEALTEIQQTVGAIMQEDAPATGEVTSQPAKSAKARLKGAQEIAGELQASEEVTPQVEVKPWELSKEEFIAKAEKTRRSAIRMKDGRVFIGREYEHHGDVTARVLDMDAGYDQKDIADAGWTYGKKDSYVSEQESIAKSPPGDFQYGDPESYEVLKEKYAVSKVPIAPEVAPEAVSEEEFKADFRKNAKPAIRLGSGEVVEAEPGQTHADVYTKAQEQGLDIGLTEQEISEGRRVIVDVTGWTYRGKFISQDELLEGGYESGVTSEAVRGVPGYGEFPAPILAKKEELWKPEGPAVTQEGEVASFIKGPEGKIGISVKALSKGIGFAKHAMQRFLTSRGELPQSVFDTKVKRDGLASRIQRDLAYKIKDYDRAIGKAYPKRDLTQEETQAYDGALKGEVPLESLPTVKLQETVGIMRNDIDALSRRYIELGAVSGKLEGTIIENKGMYVNRSYRAFDDPKWAESVPKEVRNKAEAFLRQKYPNKAEKEIQGLIEKILYEGKAAESPIAAIRQAFLGAKDLSILTRRKDIPPEIRALLGEYRDPRVNYVKTVTKLGNLIANHQFLTEVRELGRGTFLSDVPIVNEYGELKTRIAADKSSPMHPLNGLYVTPEIKEAFARAADKGASMPGWVRFALAANATVKLNKTVLSLMTHVRNFVAGPGFAMMQGHWRVGKLHQSVMATMTNIAKMDNQAWRNYYLYLTELGVVSQDVKAGELRAHVQDATKQGLDEFALGLERRRARKTEKLVKRGLSIVSEAYIAEDDFWKIYGYENEKARYSEALPELTTDELDRHCAGIVQNTYPTWSHVPEGVRLLRRFPLMGAFVSFPAEIIRTGYNTVDLAQQELRDPQLRKIGAERAVGCMMALAASSGIAVAAGMLFGVSSDDDDDLRWFVPPWQKNSTFLHLGRRPNGDFRYVDLAYSDPHNTLITPVKAFLSGRDTKEGIWNAMKDIAAPFAGEDILFGKFVDVWSNNDEGRKIYNPQDSVNRQAVDVTKHLWEAFEPGTITSARRITKGFLGIKSPTGRTYNPGIETIAVITGQRIQDLDVAESLKWRARDFNREIRDADRLLSRVLTRGGHVSDGEIRDAYQRADTARRGLWRDVSGAAQAAVRLGVPFDEAVTTLVANGVTKLDIDAVMAGVYNKRRITTAQLKAIHQANSAEFDARKAVLANLLEETQEIQE